MQLANLQGDIATAVVQSLRPASAALLTGGADPTQRVAIHGRHYAASLTRSIAERFPATVWLAGSDFVTAAAMRFAREHPPTRPCIAEYGDGFPAYLASFADVRLPCLGQFATLDWHLGRLAIEADAPPLETLADSNAATLVDVRLTLQPGTTYLTLDWSLDELIRFFLTSDAPDQYALRAEPVWLELRGSRGELWLNRLTRGDYAFRQALVERSTLGDATEFALHEDECFEPGGALLAMLQSGLITGVIREGGTS